MKKLMWIFLIIIGTGIGITSYAAAGVYTRPIDGLPWTADSNYWAENDAWLEAGHPGSDDTANIHKGIILGYWDNNLDKAVYHDQAIGQVNIAMGSNENIALFDQKLTILNGGSWANGSFNGFWDNHEAPGTDRVDVYGTLNLVDDPGLQHNTGHIIANGTEFNNYGNIIHTGQGYFQLTGNNAKFNNYGLYEVAGEGTLSDANNGHGQMINNHGMVRKVSSGETVIGGDFTNHASGTVQAEAGTLYLSQAPHLNGGVLSGGKWVSKNGAAIKLTSTTGTIITNNADIELDGSGSTIGHAVGHAPWVVTNIDDTLEENQGTLKISNGRHFYSTVSHFTNSGLLTIGEGSTFTMGDGNFTQTVTGKIDGTGIFEGNLVNEGMVSPGNSPGTLIISGDYSQTSTGVFDVEIAGLTNFDILDISGTASLAGMLTVSFLDNYTPDKGDIFDILWAESIAGVFEMSDDLKALFDISYDNFDSQLNRSFVRLEYIYGDSGSQQNPVPEPGTLLLLGFGLLSIAGLSRKKLL